MKKKAYGNKKQAIRHIFVIIPLSAIGRKWSYWPGLLPDFFFLITDVIECERMIWVTMEMKEPSSDNTYGITWSSLYLFNWVKLCKQKEAE